jgi:hypothetical protein
MLAEFAHKHVAHACCACWFLMLKRYSHSISVAACEPDLRNSCRPCQKNKLILSQPLLSEQYDLRAHCEDVQLIEVNLAALDLNFAFLKLLSCAKEFEKVMKGSDSKCAECKMGLYK